LGSDVIRVKCEVRGAVLLGMGPWSIPDPMDKVPQDENETKSSHNDRHSCVILVKSDAHTDPYVPPSL